MIRKVDMIVPLGRSCGRRLNCYITISIVCLIAISTSFGSPGEGQKPPEKVTDNTQANFWSELRVVDTLMPRADVSTHGYRYLVANDTQIALGCPSDDENAPSGGAVVVFEKNAKGIWNDGQKLAGEPGLAEEGFGYSVSMFRDLLVAGAPFSTRDQKSAIGSAYVFRKQENGKWVREAKLTASDGMAGDLFGFSVSAGKDTVFIHASDNAEGPENVGAVYVFSKLNDGSWKQAQKISAPVDGVVDDFTDPIHYEGETLLVPSWREEDAGAYGVVYLYRKGAEKEWACESILNPAESEAVAYGLVGSDIAKSENFIATNAENKDFPSGVVYIYSKRNTGWTLVETLTPPQGSDLTWFGIGVDIEGDTCAVSARSGSGEFQISVYSRSACDEWSLVQDIEKPFEHKASTFARAFLLSGDELVVQGTTVVESYAEAQFFDIPAPPVEEKSDCLFVYSPE